MKNLIISACPSGCRCVSGEGEGSNEVDDEGYCNNWCGNRGSCGHSEAYTSDPKGQIDCRGCTNIETDFGEKRPKTLLDILTLIYQCKIISGMFHDM